MKRIKFTIIVITLLLVDSHFAVAEPLSAESEIALLNKNNIIETTASSKINDGIIFNGPKAVWRSVINNKLSAGMSAPLFVSANNLFVFLKGITGTQENGYICSVSNSTGKLKWTKNISGIYEVPLFLDGVIYLGSSDGNFYAIDRESGKEKWHVKTSNWGISGMRTIAKSYGGLVYFGYDDGILYAVNKSNGELVWSKNVGGTIYASPEIDENIIYFGTSKGVVYALDAVSGAELWKEEVSENIFFLNFLIDDDFISFLWSKNKTEKRLNRNVINFTTFNKITGELKWEHNIETDKTVSWPINSGGNIFFSDGNKLKAISIKTGKKVWELESLVDFFPALQMYQDNIIVANGTPHNQELEGQKYIYSVKLSTGKINWQYPMGSALTKTITVTNDKVIFKDTESDVTGKLRDTVVFISLDNGIEVGKIVMNKDEQIQTPISTRDNSFYITTIDKNNNSYIYKMDF